MKKFLVLCAGMMLVASAAMAQGNGLHMSWVNCPNAGGLPSEAFPCDGSGLHNLNGTLSVAASTPGVVALDGIIDLLFNGRADTPAFWQFQSGGCNNSGLALSAARPGTGCGVLTATAANGNTNTLCGSGGTGCTPFITGYAFGGSIGFPANRARLVFTQARSAAAPVTLAANALTGAHFVFTFSFFEDNAVGVGGGECEGCEASAGITWNQAVLYNTNASTGGEGIAVAISSGDPGSANASTGANCVACVTVPNKSRTWGQLKSLYR